PNLYINNLSTLDNTGISGSTFVLTRVQDGTLSYYQGNGNWSASAADAATLTTSSLGVITVPDLEDGTYYLTQTGVAQNYYPLQYTIQFNLSYGELSVPYGTYGAVVNTETDEEWVLDVYNVPVIQKTFDLEIYNVSTKDLTQTIDGSTFTLAMSSDGTLSYYVSDGTWSQNSADAATLTTQNGGLIYLSSLDPGNYVLTQKSVPSGYRLLSTPINFAIDSNGVITSSNVDVIAGTSTSLALLVGNAPVSSSSGSTPSEPTVPDSYSVSIQNLSTQNLGPISGNEFVVYKTTGGTNYYLTADSTWNSDYSQAYTFTTDEFGSFTVSNLVAGTYYLWQTYVQPQYYEISEPVAFAISNDGVLSTPRDSQHANVQSSTSPLVLDVYNTPISQTAFDLAIYVVDAYVPTTTLNGASFTLSQDIDGITYYYTQDGGWSELVEDAATLTTANDGYIYLQGFDPGSYSLQQTATSSGYYALTDPVTFTITKEGDISTSSDMAIAGSAVTLILLIGNIPEESSSPAYDFTITKVSSEDPETRLPDASFILMYYSDGEIYYLAPNDTWFGTYETARVFTTDGNGFISLPPLSAGTYYLYETQAPEGYQSIGEVLVLDVSEAGELSTIPDSRVAVENANALISNDPVTPENEEPNEDNPSPEVDTNNNLPGNGNTPTTPSSESKLPQTGQLLWPIPVLIVIGCGCIAAALILRRKRKADKK
ncbi:MAG: hypothetical protein LUB61_03775, partial [Eggerthellaceae bacterium]|nr:hypothetical protein [Eggerthellaceae bacterium]